MEIDEISLQDELTSGFLVKYLNGEISFDEWLQLQSGDNAEGNVLGDEVVPNESNDINMLDGAFESVAPGLAHGVLFNMNIIACFYVQDIQVQHNMVEAQNNACQNLFTRSPPPPPPPTASFTPAYSSPSK
jgi:hypothetical protein